MISYIYRYAKSLTYKRRGKEYKSITHMAMFMDDMLLMSSNRAELKKAVERIIRWTADNLHWMIKPDWHIRDLKRTAIDMMGYVIHSDGHVTMRARNFVHSRRLALRFQAKGNLSLKQAKRLMSYKGYYMYSDSEYAYRKYCFEEAFEAAGKIISKNDRRNRDGTG